MFRSSTFSYFDFSFPHPSFPLLRHSASLPYSASPSSPLLYLCFISSPFPLSSPLPPPHSSPSPLLKRKHQKAHFIQLHVSPLCISHASPSLVVLPSFYLLSNFLLSLCTIPRIVFPFTLLLPLPRLSLLLHPRPLSFVCPGTASPSPLFPAPLVLRFLLVAFS